MRLLYKDALYPCTGFIAFLAPFPSLDATSVMCLGSAVSSPITSSITAKLWQARPYGLSLTKDMTAKLAWLKGKENLRRPTISWSVAFLKTNTLAIESSLFDGAVSHYDYFSDIAGCFLHPGCTAVHHCSLHFKVSHNICPKILFFFFLCFPWHHYLRKRKRR